MSKTTTSKKTGKPLDPLRTMTEAEVMAAALADPDAKPLTPKDFKRMKRIPRAKIIRRALGSTLPEATYTRPAGQANERPESGWRRSFSSAALAHELADLGLLAILRPAEHRRVVLVIMDVRIGA